MGREYTLAVAAGATGSSRPTPVGRRIETSAAKRSFAGCGKLSMELHSEQGMATKKLDFSLRLRHDSADLSVVTRQLGFASEVGWNKGDQKLSLKGLPLEGRRESSYRSFPLGVFTNVGLEETIPECLKRLMPFSSVLRAFVDSGGIASIAVGWFGDSDVGGDRISADAVAAMAKLHLTLDLYLYFGPNESKHAATDA